jgi:hypothetical protein
MLLPFVVELGFVAWIAAFLDDALYWSAQHRRELIEQLDRASLSVLLNTAGGGNETPAARFLPQIVLVFVFFFVVVLRSRPFRSGTRETPAACFLPSLQSAAIRNPP